MDDAAVVDAGVPIDDLVHEGDGLRFTDAVPAGDHLREVPAVAELGDYVGVVFCVVDVVHFYYVFGVLQNLQHFDLRGQQILMHLSLYHLHVDHLYRHHLLCIQ